MTDKTSESVTRINTGRSLTARNTTKQQDDKDNNMSHGDALSARERFLSMADTFCAELTGLKITNPHKESCIRSCRYDDELSNAKADITAEVNTDARRRLMPTYISADNGINQYVAVDNKFVKGKSCQGKFRTSITPSFPETHLGTEEAVFTSKSAKHVSFSQNVNVLGFESEKSCTWSSANYAEVQKSQEYGEHYSREDNPILQNSASPVTITESPKRQRRLTTSVYKMAGQITTNKGLDNSVITGSHLHPADFKNWPISNSKKYHNDKEHLVLPKLNANRENIMQETSTEIHGLQECFSSRLMSDSIFLEKKTASLHDKMHTSSFISHCGDAVFQQKRALLETGNHQSTRVFVEDKPGESMIQIQLAGKNLQTSTMESTGGKCGSFGPNPKRDGSRYSNSQQLTNNTPNNPQLHSTGHTSGLLYVSKENTQKLIEPVGLNFSIPVLLKEPEYPFAGGTRLLSAHPISIPKMYERSSVINTSSKLLYDTPGGYAIPLSRRKRISTIEEADEIDPVLVEQGEETQSKNTFDADPNHLQQHVFPTLLKSTDKTSEDVNNKFGFSYLHNNTILDKFEPSEDEEIILHIDESDTLTHTNLNDMPSETNVYFDLDDGCSDQTLETQNTRDIDDSCNINFSTLEDGTKHFMSCPSIIVSHYEKDKKDSPSYNSDEEGSKNNSKDINFSSDGLSPDLVNKNDYCTSLNINNLYSAAGSTEDDDADLNKLKEMTKRLGLKTQRPSYVEWKAEYIEKPILARFQPGVDRENVGSIDERKQDVNNAIDWIRKELMDMRQQDHQLARELITLRYKIQELKLQKSCIEHQEIIDDATSELQDRDDTEDIYDFPFTGLTNTPLGQLGVTRMNLSARRFSCC